MTNKSKDQFEKWMLSLMAMLIAGGVAGLWSMTMSVARLEERVANWVEVNNRLFAGIAEQQRDIQRRVEDLERSRHPGAPRREDEPAPGRWVIPPGVPSDRRQ